VFVDPQKFRDASIVRVRGLCEPTFPAMIQRLYSKRLDSANMLLPSEHRQPCGCTVVKYHALVMFLLALAPSRFCDYLDWDYQRLLLPCCLLILPHHHYTRAAAA